MFSFSRALLACAAIVFAAGCSDPVDKAAKQRIFSPEDPPKAVASAAEEIPTRNLGGDAQLTRRVLSMGAAETTERLGPHRYDAHVRFAWKAEGGAAVELSEQRTLIAGPGGVAGDFHGKLENSRDHGLEVLRVDGKVYARNRYGSFRQRLRDRGMAERAREEFYGALAELDELFQHRIELRYRDTAEVNGRKAHRYGVELGQPVVRPAAVALPPIPAPKNGVDASTRRRLAFHQNRTPEALEGMIAVDAETGTVLWTKVTGSLSVPASEEALAANLTLSLESAIKDVGQARALQAPKEFLPDADKPQGIADALDRFGIPRAGRGADKAEAAAPAEPADEEVEAAE